MKIHSTKKAFLSASMAAVATAGVVVAVSHSPAGATPPSGVTSVLLGSGHFGSIDAQARTDVDPGTRTDYWQAALRTKGATDLQVLQNTIPPGGTFGWHSHPGPSLVIVKSGTATFYEGDDPTCTPHVVTSGNGLVDDGSTIHVIRNEGTVDLVTVVASLLPSGATRRIDQPRPGNCPF